MKAIIFLLVAIPMFGYSQKIKYPSEGTIYACDELSGIIVDPVNVWQKKGQPGGKIIDKVHHNDKVTIIKRKGNYVYIKTKSKIKGWVGYFFIKEIKMPGKKDAC